MKTSNNTENFALKAKSPKNRIYFWGPSNHCALMTEMVRYKTAIGILSQENVNEHFDNLLWQLTDRGIFLL